MVRDRLRFMALLHRCQDGQLVYSGVGEIYSTMKLAISCCISDVAVSKKKNISSRFKIKRRTSLTSAIRHSYYCTRGLMIPGGTAGKRAFSNLNAVKGCVLY